MGGWKGGWASREKIEVKEKNAEKGWAVGETETR